MVLIDSQIHGPSDLKACIHKLNLVGKLVGSNKATHFPVGVSLYPRQRRVYAASIYMCVWV